MIGLLKGYTPETDSTKLGELSPLFRPLAIATFEQVSLLLGKRVTTIVPRVFEGWRSPARQLRFFQMGRMPSKGGWTVINPAEVITSLLPADAPHCQVTPDGKPASMAIDIYLVDASTGLLLPNKHPAWALVPAAAFLCGGETVRCGAFWDLPRDWGHIELKDWNHHLANGSKGLV